MTLRRLRFVQCFGLSQAQLEKGNFFKLKADVGVATETDDGFSTWPSTCLSQLKTDVKGTLPTASGSRR